MVGLARRNGEERGAEAHHINGHLEDCFARLNGLVVFGEAVKAPESEKTERLGKTLAEKALLELDFLFREQGVSDYGVDAHAESLGNERSPTGQLLGVQLKTGDSYFTETTDEGIVFRSDREHFEYWKSHSLPIIVALCNLDSDTVFWEHVRESTVELTKTRAKMLVPYDQRLDADSRERLLDLLTPLLPDGAFTELSFHDLSSPNAKRYSVEIVLNGSQTKPEIAAVVRQVTMDSVKRIYHRNERLRDIWEDSEADVVYLYVYLSPEDRVTANWVCRSNWCRQGLSAQDRPILFSGEDVGSSVIVEWRTDYSTLSALQREYRLPKERYIAWAIPLVDELHDLARMYQGSVDQLRDRTLDQKGFLEETGPVRALIDDAYMASTDSGLPPYECGAFDEKMQEILALLHNAIIPYSKDGISKFEADGRLELALSSLTDFFATVELAKYELTKVLR